VAHSRRLLGKGISFGDKGDVRTVAEVRSQLPEASNEGKAASWEKSFESEPIRSFPSVEQGSGSAGEDRASYLQQATGSVFIEASG
jgi:hypothetical protein